jgi:hypothetical protein
MEKELLKMKAWAWVVANGSFIAEKTGIHRPVTGWKAVIAVQLIHITENNTNAGFLEEIHKKFLADISAPELTNQEG